MFRPILTCGCGRQNKTIRKNNELKIGLANKRMFERLKIIMMYFLKIFATSLQCN